MMDERVVMNTLDDSDHFSNDSFDDNDTDSMYRVESDNNNNSQDSSKDEDQIDVQTFDSSQLEWDPMTGIKQKNFNFMGNSGLLVILDEDIEPIDYFELFFTDEVVESLKQIETLNNC